MLIKGVIEEIIYRNEDNNYSVIALQTDDEVVTAVGKFPLINEGECVEMEGAFSSHPKYGKQFNVNKIKIARPNTKEGIIKYLSSGLIKGVGIITATAIANKFDEAALEIIEFNPSRLAEVKGISLNKANDIANSFNEIKDMRNAVMFMQSYNISTNLAIKVYNTYYNKTEFIIKQNPYKLIEDVEGIGFFTADKIALNLGIEKDSKFRYRAAVLHVLKENCDKCGNTFLNYGLLKNELKELLKINKLNDFINEVIDEMIIDNIVHIVKAEDENENKVMLAKFYNIEKLVAYSINLLSLNKTDPPLNIDEEISVYENLNKIEMHEAQKEAVRTAILNGVSVITGGPGTGKTTIIKCIMQIFKHLSLNVKLLAPTGRAAKRLSESTNEDASTIHRALEPDFNKSNLFKYNNYNKLQADVIIIDEVSMVDIQLMFYLVRALKNGTRLIMVGDKDQLPSVGAGNVLHDIIESGVVPVAYLTYIYRQQEDSYIISNAHLINSSQMPLLDNAGEDFFYDNKDNVDDILNSVINMSVARIPKYLNIDSSKIQVLAPMRAGVCGIDNLNRELQEKLNPSSIKKRELETDKIIYRENDRVMQIANNYELEWVKDYERGLGVFNGDIGTIIKINEQISEVTVLFEDGRVVNYLKTNLNELVLAYAITIHKSQGSEFDVVIIPISGGPPTLLTKNLLYTAVTRAKKMVVLVGTKRNIAAMVKNKHTLVRLTMLKELLLEAKTLITE